MSYATYASGILAAAAGVGSAAVKGQRAGEKCASTVQAQMHFKSWKGNWRNHSSTAYVHLLQAPVVAPYTYGLLLNQYLERGRYSKKGDVLSVRVSCIKGQTSQRRGGIYTLSEFAAMAAGIMSASYYIPCIAHATTVTAPIWLPCMYTPTLAFV